MTIVCITGGGGYVGRSIAEEALNHGFLPILIDWRPPTSNLKEETCNGIRFEVADVRDESALSKIFKGATVVFHVASYGMSGSSQLDRKLVRDINVGGTEVVLRAAIAAGVESLVFTSTYNVVFGGQSITRGDETMPYFPLHRHPDVYSATKAMAEMMVLKANMTPLPVVSSTEIGEAKQRYLRTCALRPAAIWGPDEERHIPRVVKYIEQGLFKFTFGDPKAKMDFVHVRNLAQAHILAAKGLRPATQYKAAGKAYFISDGEEHAINNFDFFKQLVDGLGYPPPRLWLPLWLVYYFALVTEHLHRVLHPWIPFEPLLTRAEVYKSGVNHWFTIEKARQELGYTPRAHDFQDVVDALRAKGHGARVASKLDGRPAQRLGPTLLAVGVAVTGVLLALISWLLCGGGGEGCVCNAVRSFRQAIS